MFMDRQDLSCSIRWAWLAFVVVGGCGGAAMPHDAVASAATDPQDIHLGCTVITRAMIEARRATFDEPSETEAIRELLIRRAVARRVADERHIDVREADVSEAIRRIALRHALLPEQLYSAAEQRGLDTDTYRADIHDDLLVERVGLQLTPPVSEQAVDDEMARSHTGPRDDVRAALQRPVIDAELDRLGRAWMAVPTRQTNAGCVESE